MLDQDALNTLFLNARTHNAWQTKDVSDDLLQEIYDLAKMGPTSVNCLPMRIVFVKSSESKAKLKPCLMEGNVEKTMQAPVTAIIGMDLEFYNNLPQLFPAMDVKGWFDSNPDFAKETAFRNGSLQGAYFIIAARALGLDCGPMSGFDPAAVDAAFFMGTSYKTNFLINLGYGDEKALYPRGERLSFEESCQVV